MAKWKKRWFSDRYDSGDISIFLLYPEFPQTGIIYYSTIGLQVVAQWEFSGDGVLIWSNRIAQIYPEAAVPPELVLTKVINDIREAFEQCSRMKLEVSVGETEPVIISSDDWIRRASQ